MTLDELDKFAAEKIMGFEILSHSPKEKHFYVYQDSRLLYLTGEGCEEYRGLGQGWQPTRNIAQAWELLEKFCKDNDWAWSLNMLINNHTECTLQKFSEKYYPDTQIQAETAPEAITRACLLASGVEL